MAEAVFAHEAKLRGVEVEIDSAGELSLLNDTCMAPNPLTFILDYVMKVPELTMLVMHQTKGQPSAPHSTETAALPFPFSGRYHSSDSSYTLLVDPHPRYSLPLTHGRQINSDLRP